MKLRRALIAVALLTGSVFAAGPAGASKDGSITLIGRRSASAVFTIDEPVRIRCCRTRAQNDGRPRPLDLEVTTSGTYAGFIVERVGGGGIVAGGMRVPAMDWGGIFEMAIPIAEGPLQPGTYRIHLLTDAPARVRITVEGLDRDLTLKPSRRSPVRASFGSIGVGSGAPIAFSKRTLRVREKTVVVMAHDARFQWGQAHVMRHCISDVLGLCRTSGNELYAVACPACSEGVAAMASVYWPADLHPGERDAVIVHAGVGVIPESRALVLTFR